MNAKDQGNRPPTNGSEAAIARYADAFAALSPQSLDALLELLSDDVRFCDPFNDVRGKAAVRAIFAHMFKVCENPRFHVTDIAHGRDAKQPRAYIRWRMSGRLKRWPRTAIGIEGVSEIHLDKNGLVRLHIDHWDSASQLLAKLPVIGALIRRILALFRVAR